MVNRLLYKTVTFSRFYLFFKVLYGWRKTFKKPSIIFYITVWHHSHRKRKIIWKQTKRYCFNTFNPNFLEPRPPNLHKNCKQTEAKLIRYYFLERRYSASFICQKCLAKTVQYQVAVFQEKIKELAFSKFHLQIMNLTRSGAKILSTLFWNTDNVINL